MSAISSTVPRAASPRRDTVLAALAAVDMLPAAGQPVSCPRCGSEKTHGWGIRDGRRRFRCLGCGRTFNELTGTPLAGNRRLDRVPAYREELLRSSTLRATAASCGIDPGTAFRWRHVLLRELGRREPPPLRGIVEITHFGLRHSEKGLRSSDGVGRSRGEPLHHGLVGRQWVFVLADEHGTSVLRQTPLPRAVTPALESTLAPERGYLIELRAAVGPKSTYAAFCAKHGVTFRSTLPLFRTNDVCDVALARGAADRLKRWLRRFKGVSSRYLNNYLTWHAFLEEQVQQRRDAPTDPENRSR